MNFSSLVLMEKDKESNAFIRELGSYEVSDAAEYISKFYCQEGIVYIFFDTKSDVEEWEYTAIFDLFDESIFTSKGYDIESVDDEYNPTWKITFKYEEEYSVVHNHINFLCDLFQQEMEKVFDEMKEKAEEYK